MATWPTDIDYSDYARDQIFALGIVTSRFNSLERVFFEKFQAYLQQGPDISAKIFGRIDSNRQALLLKLMAERSNVDEDIVDNDTWFIRGYRVCADNRNMFVHSELYSLAGSLFYSDEEGVGFVKREGRASYRYNFSRWTLEQIRTVADEISAYNHFGETTLQVLEHRYPHLRRHVLSGHVGFVPLPGKPPLPGALSPQA